MKTDLKINTFVYVVVNFLSQLIFIFVLFLANITLRPKTKEKHMLYNPHASSTYRPWGPTADTTRQLELMNIRPYPDLPV